MRKGVIDTFGDGFIGREMPAGLEAAVAPAPPERKKPGRKPKAKQEPRPVPSPAPAPGPVIPSPIGEPVPEPEQEKRSLFERLTPPDGREIMRFTDRDLFDMLRKVSCELRGRGMVVTVHIDM